MLLKDLKTYVSEMSLQVLHYYHGKMAQRVNDIIGVPRNSTNNGTTTRATMLFYHAYGKRRQEYASQEEFDKVGVKVLDSYKMFMHPLSVQERNSFKDLGFEFAGNLIHTIIDNMRPVDKGPGTRPMFTRQLSEGDSYKTPSTTEHPHIHAVTNERGPEVKANSKETTAESFRFRAVFLEDVMQVIRKLRHDPF
ncbi:hypothetical protein HW555_013088 [Spodoptera exigua]|uniref:Uncharacterized protein n=1 Tax=Spodoptera exigua TaxID=7107 RepID=A0A835G5X9_SPOEX|nr:hypothetical protein HW555_013088 [Spodoptera exigua]